LTHCLKALLCCVLTLSLHILPAGCGVNYSLMDDGSVLVPIGSGDSFVYALKNTEFARPISLRAYPTTGDFQVSFDGGDQQVFGRYFMVAGRAVLTGVTIARGEFTAQIALDSSQRIASIVLSNGKSWKRPVEMQGPPVKRDLNAPKLFENANADLVAALQELGVQDPAGSTGGTPGGSQTPGGGGVKVDQASDTILLNNNQSLFNFSEILGNIGTLFFFNQVVPNLPTLLTLFSVFGSIQFVLGIVGLVAPGGTGPGTAPGGSARLRVVNNLTGEIPIWFVTLVADPDKNLAGGNLLGQEAIPAGTTREFNVVAGTRDVNVIVPSGQSCFELFEFFDLVLTDGAATEIVITDLSIGKIIPDGCDNG
jgi:hypothetical protein